MECSESGWRETHHTHTYVLLALLCGRPTGLPGSRIAVLWVGPEARLLLLEDSATTTTGGSEAAPDARGKGTAPHVELLSEHHLVRNESQCAWWEVSV